MAKKNLVRLLFELSQDAATRKRYRADSEAVMREFGLSTAESKLLREGKASKIKAHLGKAWPAGPTIIIAKVSGPTIIISTAAKKRR
jgi:Aromatic-ring-opening dioxygenase LigAB, LigA subunit